MPFDFELFDFELLDFELLLLFLDVELLLDFDLLFLEDELLDLDLFFLWHFLDELLLELFEELFFSHFLDELLLELEELFFEDFLDADEDLFFLCPPQRHLRTSSTFLVTTTILSDLLATQNSDPLKSKVRMENTLIENNGQLKNLVRFKCSDFLFQKFDF